MDWHGEGRLQTTWQRHSSSNSDDWTSFCMEEPREAAYTCNVVHPRRHGNESKVKHDKMLQLPTTCRLKTYTDLAGIDNFLAKKSVFASILVEQTPVHLNVPRQCVARPHDLCYYPQVQEGTVLCITVAVACYHNIHHTHTHTHTHCSARHLVC